MNKVLCRLAVLVSALALVGCSTVTNPGAPDQSFNVDQDIQDLESIFKEKGVTIISYYSPEFESATADRKKQLRNQFISQRLTLMNIQYIKFIRSFAVDKAQFDTAADMLVIGLDLAGTLVGGASTKAILAAISGGTSASRISINKNFFLDKTVPVLITAMNAARKEALLPIFDGIDKAINEYPFSRALSDLHFYYQAGTFIGALQAIQKDAGVKEAAADVILFRKYSRVSLSVDSFTERKDIKASINALSPVKAKALITKILTIFPETASLIAAQYPDDVRDADPDGSRVKVVLERLVSNTALEPEDMIKWRSALDSL